MFPTIHSQVQTISFREGTTHVFFKKRVPSHVYGSIRFDTGEGRFPPRNFHHPPGCWKFDAKTVPPRRAHMRKKSKQFLAVFFFGKILPFCHLPTLKTNEYSLKIDGLDDETCAKNGPVKRIFMICPPPPSTF